MASSVRFFPAVNSMKRILRTIWRESGGFIVFVVLMVLFRSAVADWNEVPTGSMKPTIVEGDRILVNKLAYDWHIPLTHVSLRRTGEPKRGDIVVFDSTAAGKRLVKRVIGLPGETVEMRNNRLWINGAPARYGAAELRDGAIFATETWGAMRHRIRLLPIAGPLASFAPVRVPSGHYLVLGDNRDESADSRVIGFVPRAEIVGRSRRVVLSLDYDHYYLPRGGRFFERLG